MSPVLKTSSARETEAVGEHLGSLARRGDVFCLFGNLGAGKTCLARGIARGLGVEDYVTSSTFTLINEYQGRLPLFHMDVYRLEGPEELEDLGYEEYFYGDGVTVLEWPERVMDLLPEERLDIHISAVEEDNNTRLVTLEGRGEKYDHLVRELTARVGAGN